MAAIFKHAALPSIKAIERMTDAEAETCLTALRWLGGIPECPRCENRYVYDYSSCGRTLYRCSQCRYQFSVTSGTIFSARKLPTKVYLMALALVESDEPALRLAEYASIQYKSAWSMKKKIERLMGKHPGAAVWGPAPVRKRVNHYLDCTHCSKQFLDAKGERVSSMKLGRTKHAFCSHDCAMKYGARKRCDDTCRRCKKPRKELSTLWPSGGVTGVPFNYGYCPKCYGLLKAYRFDEELCAAHELTQTLKKEPTNDHITREEHRRPPQNASRSHRGRA